MQTISLAFTWEAVKKTLPYSMIAAALQAQIAANPAGFGVKLSRFARSLETYGQQGHSLA